MAEAGNRLGSYELLGRLGSGGMGDVYRAFDPSLGREVAIKVLSERLRDERALLRFRREAQLLASVSHPNIATIFSVEASGGVPFLVLELVPGETIAERLERGPLPRDLTYDVAIQVAGALDTAHRRRVVHRDLKPANVMLSPEGWVKVLDFGLAKLVDDMRPTIPDDVSDAGGPASGPPTSVNGRTEATAPVRGVAARGDDEESIDSAMTLAAGLTATGATAGTLPYMSPEQVLGEVVDERSDIWAFGCLLYECLTGERAFSGRRPAEVSSAILGAKVDWRRLPADLPPGIQRLLVRCLTRNPKRRLHSMADARIELEDAVRSNRELEATVVDGEPRPSSGLSGPFALPEDSAELSYLDEIGGYTVVERLAIGGMTEVYRAWDRDRSREVALKVLRSGVAANDEDISALRREAAALSELRHEHIAALYDVGREGTREFVATELVEGRSLASRLAEGPLAEREAIGIALQVADALACAHRADVVHCDVKPANVMLSADAQVKLVDFGIARAVAETASGELGVSKVVGTPPYAAPEVMRGARPTRASDLYSLGAVLHRMVTGKTPPSSLPPEAGGTDSTGPDSKSMASRLEATGGPVPSAELSGLLDELLAIDPAARPASADAVAERLEELQRRALSSGRVRERPALGWLIAVAGLAAVAAVLWLVLGTRSGERAGPASAPPASRSLVVLPSRVLGSSEEAYLGEAVANTLSSLLAGTEGLVTKVPPSASAVEQVGSDLQRVAEAYAVDTVVVSTVRADADRIDLNAQLVEPATRQLLWASDFEGERSGYAELLRQVAVAVRAALLPGVSGDVAAAVHGSDVELLLQRGRFHSALYSNAGRAEDFDQALAAFESAEALDPSQAEAAAEIAFLYGLRLRSGGPSAETSAEVARWSQRALERDPTSSTAWAARTVVEADPGRRLTYALRAAALDPRDGAASIRLSNALGNFSPRLALEAARHASALSPLDQIGHEFEAFLELTIGRPEPARELIEQVLAADPELPRVLAAQVSAMLYPGHLEQAAAGIENLRRAAGEGRVSQQWVDFLGDVLAVCRALSEGAALDTVQEELDRVLRVARGDVEFSGSEPLSRGIGPLLARFGAHDAALGLMVERSRRGRTDSYETLRLHTDLRPLRGDPRFDRLLAEAQRRWEEGLEILEQARTVGELPPVIAEPLPKVLAEVEGAS